MLWKSLLSFRAEPWHWVEDGESALWHVVDVSRGVDSAWTERLSGQRRIRGIALARQWLEIPAPVWTFFKVPLVTEEVHRWLDRELRAASALPSAPAAAQAAPAGNDNPWLHKRLKLTRWPDVGRYGEDSIALTVACSMMLRNWTPYEELIQITPARTSLQALLVDATQRGILQVALDALPEMQVAATPGTEEEGRWGLLKKIWKRFQ